MSAYPPDTYDERDDPKAHYLFEEHMNQLDVEEAERERIMDEAFLAYGAEGFEEDAAVPA